MALVVLNLTACSESVSLQAGLNDNDANEIVSALNKSGIEARKQRNKEGVALLVSSEDISRASQVLHELGLPQPKTPDLGDLFKPGMIETPMQERIRYIYGLSGELEHTLRQFDNVVIARVHVVLPERIAPGEPIQPSSAAVFVKYAPPFDEDIAIPRIRRLIASSIPGLASTDNKDKVSVVLSQSSIKAPGTDLVSLGPFKVHAKSSTMLQLLLIMLILFSFIGLSSIALLIALRHKGFSLWFNQIIQRNFQEKKSVE